MPVGRPRKFRNNSEKQKAYRANKKQREMLDAALRNRQKKHEDQRIRRLIRELGFVKVWSYYADLLPEIKENHYACPCRSKQVLATVANASRLVGSCDKCNGSIGGMIKYFERRNSS